MSADRVAIVTGGSRGIGRATAIELARHHFVVVTCGTNEKGLEETARGLAEIGARFQTVTADMGHKNQVEDLIARVDAEFGRVDVLVNNAGFAALGPVESISDDDFERTLAVNISGVFYATRSAWPIFKRQGKGTIINISSLSSFDPFPGFQVYGASKAWINLFTKAIAEEGRPANIRAFSLALGAVETDMLRGLFPEFPYAQALDPGEVAQTIVALTNDETRHASGSTLIVKK